MSSIIRWSLMCVTFAFVTLASCGDEQPTTAKPAMSVTPTSQPTATKEPTLTPTIQPTAAATQTPQESIVKIGTTVEAGGSTYTVNEIMDPAPEGGFRAKDGNRLITIDVTQKAIDDEEPFNLFYFAVQDSDGFVYEPSPYSSAIMEPSMGSGELGSGQLVRGWVSFEIPDTATLISILAEPEVFGQRVTIVDLDPSSSPGNLVSSTTPPKPVTPSSPVLIGTTVEAGGSTYTVNEIMDPAPEGGFRAKDGNRLITIDVTQKAIDDEEPFNLFYFAVQDSDGFVYEPSPYSSAIMEPSMGSGELGSGQLVRGWVSFEIPDTATLISILAEPEVFGQRVTIANISN